MKITKFLYSFCYLSSFKKLEKIDLAANKKSIEECKEILEKLENKQTDDR